MHLFLDPSQSLRILGFLESLRGGKDCLTRRPEILLSPGSISGHGKLNHDLGLCPVGKENSLHCLILFSSVQFNCSVDPTLCNPIDCSTPGFPVHHQLLEPAQTHVHCIGDAIQSSHTLSFPSPPTFNLSQHQGLFQ